MEDMAPKKTSVNAQNGVMPVLGHDDNLHNDGEKYKALLKTANIGMWEYFPDKEFLWCNLIWFSMLGRSKGDFDFSGDKNVNAVWMDLLHPEDAPVVIAGLTAYSKKPEGVFESYYRMLHVDGSWVWIWARGSLLHGANEAGGLVITGTAIDVTWHKKAEEEIQQERILLRTLIDNLPDVIYIKDKEGRKIIANRADYINIGVKSEAEVLGKTDLELFPNEIGRRGYEDDMSILQEGKAIINKDEFFLEEGGTKRWILTSKLPVRDENGNIIRLLGIGRDITKRKQAEESLNKLNEDLVAQSEELSRQAEDLKILNAELARQKEQELEKAIAQSKFEIASEVLHDIGNAVVGFGSHLNRISNALAQNNLDNVKNLVLFLKNHQVAIAGAIGDGKAEALVSITDGISKTQARNQQEIKDSIGELANIISHIQEILNIQRQFVRSHGGQHERKLVNLLNIIDDCKAMLFATFEKKGILFTVNIKPDSYIIRGDQTKLMQVILNILKNSIEAIDFEAANKKIEMSMYKVDDVIELVIADSGQGFDAETGGHLFERGFTTKKTGTGLGLYNCRSIVESHAGSFEISSAGPGLGAVATISVA